MLDKVTFIRPDHAMIMALKDHKIVDIDDPLIRMYLPVDWPLTVVDGHRYVVYLPCEKIAIRPDLALFIMRNLNLIAKHLDGFLIGVSLSQLPSNPALQSWMKKANWPVRFNGDFSTEGVLTPPHPDRLHKGYGLDLYKVEKIVDVKLASWLKEWDGFDWYYQFSDSGTVWRRGQDRYTALVSKIPKGKEDEWLRAMDGLRPAQIRNGA